MGKVVLIGASVNPSRFSYHAVRELQRRNFEIVAVGRRPGNIGNSGIVTELKPLADVDKVVLYINAEVQKQYYDYILALKPREILFNPGTENPELAGLALENDIEIRYDCALTLLEGGDF